MFKPCPKCGFLVALIAGREASQRCPRCGSALLSDSELLDLEAAPPPRPATPRVPDAAAPAAAEPRPDDVSEPTPPAMSAPTMIPAFDDAVQVADPQAATEARLATTDGDALATTSAPVSAHDTAAAATHDGPSFARRRHARRASDRPRWPAAVGIVVLALLLALQLLLAQRADLARDAAWRPLVIRACALLRCGVPAWHEPQAYAMIARGVRPDPARAGVLHVTATVRNDARWPQPAPVVVLSLSDVDGRVVAARAVDPQDYGHPGTASVLPGDSVDIAFDVREPAARVDAFDFQLQ